METACWKRWANVKCRDIEIWPRIDLGYGAANQLLIVARR